MRRRCGIWSLLSLLMIAGLLAAACTGTPGTTTASPGGDAADPNGELTTNAGSEPDTIDPQKESFVNEVAQTMMVFESLMTFDAKTLKAIPGAAKENPKLSSDGLTYTYTLRDGLKYSDGSAVTAKDFAYGFTRTCDPAVAGEYAFTLYVIVGCEAWNTADTKKATKAELDAVGVGAEQLRTIDANAELKAQTVDVGGSCTIYVGFNNARAPFDDVKVRLAFAKSFDRAAYITDVAKIGKPATEGGFIPPGMPGYDKDDTAQKFDPAAAKTLLSQSKYANTDSLKNLKFTYSASAANKTRIEWLQQQWQNNLGITVSPDPVDATTYTSLVKKPETVPLMFRLGWCADYPDQQDWLTTVFHSSSTVTRVGYKNAEYDKLPRQADADANPESRDKTYLQASKLLSNDAAAAWWYYSATKYLRKPWVKGISDTVMDFEYGIFDLTAISVTKRK